MNKMPGQNFLRPLPYPYRAMLAICSDLDETPDRHVYWEIARFLNTTEATSMGPGVGLEVGNTIYFDMPPDQFAYWNTDDAGRAMVRLLIRSGHIDCLHSFGDLAETRGCAGRTLEELDRHGCRLKAWVDHGVAPTNFGADIMRGFGDVPGAKAYHADLTFDYGIKYLWMGRATSVVGQDAAPSLKGVFNPTHPAASVKTLAKEKAKQFLGRLGSSKYAMHDPNDLLKSVKLRDGRDAVEFMRSNPHWAGISRGEYPEFLHEILTEKILDELIRRSGTSVIYTHLGKVKSGGAPFGPKAVQALRSLAQRQRDGKILATTTRRVLDYSISLRNIEIDAAEKNGVLDLKVKTSDEELPLDGLTFYVANPNRIRLFINDCEESEFTRNEPDHTGRPSVSIPWKPLEFPHV